MEDDLDYLINEAKIEILEALKDWVDDLYRSNSYDGFGAGVLTVLTEIEERLDELQK